MATIGISVESKEMHAVLFDAAGDKVVANRVTAVVDGVAQALPTAIAGMRAAARRRSLEVDGIGVVYRTDAERDELSPTTDDDPTMVPASEAFLRWLARSDEFAQAQRVLLYYVGDNTVSVSFADAGEAQLSKPRKAVLDSLSPERIGSTVSLAWEVLDEAGVTADSVALFGDRSSNRDVVDILELGLGVPVVRVADAEQIAARGAALAAADAIPVKVATAEVAPAPETVVEPAVAEPVRRALPRKKLVLTAAVLAAVLSGGVALAATLPGDSTPPSQPQAEASETMGAGASLAGITSEVTPIPTLPPAPEPQLPPPPPAAEVVVIDPVTQQPVVTQEPVYTQQWEAPVVDRGTVETLAPIPAQSIPPNAAAVPPSTVAPPEFKVPTVIPEPGKSQEQLEQEAWDRHWQHTAEWLEQELVGN